MSNGDIIINAGEGKSIEIKTISPQKISVTIGTAGMGSVEYSFDPSVPGAGAHVEAEALARFETSRKAYIDILTRTGTFPGAKVKKDE